MNNRVSVIIPIYKVEKYLKKCVDSVINQTYKNIEIILVDDGSPDSCPQICDEYRGVDERIVVIHKKNGGLSDARNIGIEAAKGDWITFIDSDDYVSDDYIETLVSICGDDCDIGVINPMYVSENESVIVKKKVKKVYKKTGEDALEEMLYQKKFDTSAWGKIYKLELFKDIRFPIGKLYEDISTVYKTFLLANRVAYTNQKKYMYLQRSDSIMGSKFKLKDMDYVYQANDMMNEIHCRCNEKLKKAARCRFLNANFSVLLKIGKEKKFSTQKQEIINNIKRYRIESLFNIKSRFKTKVAVVLTFFHFLKKERC